MAQVNIAGVAYDGGTVEIRFNTSAFGCQEIGWDQKVDKKKVRPIGAKAATTRTPGSYEVSDPTVKMESGEWGLFLDKLPANGYSDAEFTVTVFYTHPNLGSQHVELLRCCIIGEKDSIKEGSDATMKELTLSCMQIVTNGKTMNFRKGAAVAAFNNTMRL
jgi:hypothetical protein